MLQQTLSRIAALAIFLASTAAWAANLTIPNSFVANTPAKAGEVNANFTAVETAVNSKQDRVSVITFITTSGNIAVNDFGCQRSDCPASHPLAIGGGVDLDNVFNMRITSSNPVISGINRIAVLPDGENPAPTGWTACAVNQSPAVQTLTTVAICSDQ